MPRATGAVYPTLSRERLRSPKVTWSRLYATTVRTDGIIDDPVPLATELRTQRAS